MADDGGVDGGSSRTEAFGGRMVYSLKYIRELQIHRNIERRIIDNHSRIAKARTQHEA